MKSSFLVFVTGQMSDMSVLGAVSRIIMIRTVFCDQVASRCDSQARIYNPTLIHAKLYFS